MRCISVHPMESTPTRRRLPWSPLQAATVLTCLLAASLAVAGPWSDPDFLPFDFEILMGSQASPDFIDGVDGSSYCSSLGMSMLITDGLKVGFFVRSADYDYHGPLQAELGPNAYDPELYTSTWGGYVEVGVTGRRFRPFLVLQAGRMEYSVDYLFDRPGRDGYEVVWEEDYNMFGAGMGLEYYITKPFLNLRAEAMWNARANVPSDDILAFMVGFAFRMPNDQGEGGDFFNSFYVPSGRRR